MLFILNFIFLFFILFICNNALNLQDFFVFFLGLTEIFLNVIEKVEARARRKLNG